MYRTIYLVMCQSFSKILCLNAKIAISPVPPMPPKPKGSRKKLIDTPRLYCSLLLMTSPNVY